MQAYALLMVAACWHALALGTIGLRGRIVAGITAAGMLWGALTPPWGWVQIGAATGTVGFFRWAVTEQGRAVLLPVGRELLVWTAGTLRGCWAAVWFVLSPPRTYEAPPVERPAVMPRRGDTAQVALPNGDRWGLLTPAVDCGDTAQVSVVTPVETYAGVIAGLGADGRGYNETARYVELKFGVSRSKFARDVRAAKGEAQAA